MSQSQDSPRTLDLKRQIEETETTLDLLQRRLQESQQDDWDIHPGDLVTKGIQVFKVTSIRFNYGGKPWVYGFNEKEKWGLGLVHETPPRRMDKSAMSDEQLAKPKRKMDQHCALCFEVGVSYVKTKGGFHKLCDSCRKLVDGCRPNRTV